MKITRRQLRQLIRESIMSEKVGSFQFGGQDGGDSGSSSGEGESGTTGGSSTSGASSSGYRVVTSIDLRDGQYKQGGWANTVSIRKSGGRYTGYVIFVKVDDEIRGKLADPPASVSSDPLEKLAKGEEDKYTGNIRIANKKVSPGTKVTSDGKEFTLDDDKILKIMYKKQ